jgi:HEAT repeats
MLSTICNGAMVNMFFFIHHQTSKFYFDYIEISINSLISLKNRLKIINSFSFLKDWNHFCGVSLIRALSKSKTRAALQCIAPLLKNENNCVKTEAIKALSKLKPSYKWYAPCFSWGETLQKEASSHIIPLLNDDSNCVKLEALRALSKLKAREAFHQIVPLLKDENDCVKIEAIRALSELKTSSYRWHHYFLWREFEEEASSYIIPLLNEIKTSLKVKSIENQYLIDLFHSNLRQEIYL